MKVKLTSTVMAFHLSLQVSAVLSYGRPSPACSNDHASNLYFILDSGLSHFFQHSCNQQTENERLCVVSSNRAIWVKMD